MKTKTWLVASLVAFAAVAARAQELKAPEPMLFCNDVGKQIQFYTEKLGFTVEFKFPQDGDPTFARMSRGECKFMMVSATSIQDERFQTQWKQLEGKPKGLANLLYIRVDDIGKLYDELKKKGVTFEDEMKDGPVDRPWGSRDLTARDPEGFVLAFSRPANQ